MSGPRWDGPQHASDVTFIMQWGDYDVWIVFDESIKPVIWCRDKEGEYKTYWADQILDDDGRYYHFREAIIEARPDIFMRYQLGEL